MSFKMFTGAVVVAALAWSSSVLAQATTQEPLTQAKQLLGTITAPPQSDAGRLIATLKQHFTDFATTYLTPPSTTPVGTTGAVGTSGVAATPQDWRAKYRQVEADLTALLGPETGGALPSSGGVALDPSTRSQLEMMRSHLQLFYTATMSAPDGNPVAHTGAPQTPDARATAAARPPVAPTAEAPQTPPAAAAQPATGAAGTAPAGANRMPVVETDLGMAMTLLDRMQRILDEATTEPGKVKLERGDVDEIRAEINQIRSMLRGRQR